MTSYLSATELTDALNLRDLSNPAQGHHAMQTLLDDVASALAGHWGISAETIRHSPLVAVVDNYDKLGFDPSSVTRDQRYSRYVSPTVLLRSHTSASIPTLLHELSTQASYDRLLVLPGLVYRRDAIDRTHVGAPHQVDLWRVSSTTMLTAADLQTMIGAWWRPSCLVRSGALFPQCIPTRSTAVRSMCWWVLSGSSSPSAD